METELRELGGDGAGLLLREANPNPFTDNLGNLKETRGFATQQRNQFVGVQLAVGVTAGEVNRGQVALPITIVFPVRAGLATGGCRVVVCAQLFGSVLEPCLAVLVFGFHGLFFVLCCSSSVCRPAQKKAAQQGSSVGVIFRGKPRDAPVKAAW
jgi:hypothetical protein